MIRIQVLKHLPGAREGERGKEMSGEERQPEEQCRRVDMSGSLRERRSEEQMLLAHGGRKYLLSPRGGDGN